MSVAISGIEKTDSGSRAGSIRNAILIAGSTASGKSRLALEIAEQTGGIIVNADSMQVYGVLNILSARPSAADLQRADHRLYGHVDPAVSYSTGAWLGDVSRLAESGEFDRRRPIFVGGTGLYFRALTLGLAEMPEIPADIRTRWRYRLGEEGAPKLHAALAGVDPYVAGRLNPNDGQRIVRALEVLESTGRSIADWQARDQSALVDAKSAEVRLVDIDRSLLGGRIESRVRDMVREGVLDEVKELLELKLDSSLPAMRAIGVQQFSEVLAGTVGLEDAIERVAAATRQYAKRQATWFRNQSILVNRNS